MTAADRLFRFAPARISKSCGFNFCTRPDVHHKSLWNPTLLFQSIAALRRRCAESGEERKSTMDAVGSERQPLLGTSPSPSSKEKYSSNVPTTTKKDTNHDFPMRKSCLRRCCKMKLTPFAASWTWYRTDKLGRRFPQTIAHRGYKAEHPENTMAAFEGAIKVGAHAIETDIHLSKDDVVVLSHVCLTSTLLTSLTQLTPIQGSRPKTLFRRRRKGH